MAHVRDQSVVDSALAASDAGIRDADNAAAHGVAVKTIRRWRRLYQRRGVDRGQGHLAPGCPRCDSAALSGAAYAELLGWYLGDGYVSEGRRGVFNLHVYNDVRYRELNSHILDLMRAVKPGSRPHTRLVPGCVVSTVSWKHWPCLLPQHGPGRKHERAIVLQDWQHEVVEAFPVGFLRGLFHSDGCRVINKVSRLVGGQRRTYEYGRWQFANASEDILGLCTWTLDLVDIPWRRSAERVISVSRREAVAKLDELIGLKS